MLRWSGIFLLIAVIAGLVGFGGVIAGFTSIAKILFFIFSVLFLVSVMPGQAKNVE
ncbi:DUF1328 domain-containing protein [Pseudoflavitalea sp. X16]|nr:DUF1328 domain-containing protein [Paraflavitalea devenefica]